MSVFLRTSMTWLRIKSTNSHVCWTKISTTTIWSLKQDKKPKTKFLNTLSWCSMISVLPNKQFPNRRSQNKMDRKKSKMLIWIKRSTRNWSQPCKKSLWAAFTLCLEHLRQMKKPEDSSLMKLILWEKCISVSLTFPKSRLSKLAKKFSAWKPNKKSQKPSQA